MTASPLVIGIGHPYRRDDGVGPAVVDLLDRAGSPGLRLVEAGGEPVELIDAWDSVGLVFLVDAVYAPDGEPGRIHRLDLPRSTPGAENATTATSSHGVPLGDTLALARALDRVPARIVLYAIEVADVSFGAGLSPAVAAAARTVADEIRRNTAAPDGHSQPIGPVTDEVPSDRWPIAEDLRP